MDSISFSRMQTFNTCLRKYQYIYLDKIRRAPLSKLLFGTSNHSVQEYAYGEQIKGHDRPKVKDQQDYFESAISEAIKKDGVEYDEGDNKDKMVHEGFTLIDLYNPIGLGITPVAVERPFELQFPGHDWTLTGRIDLVQATKEVTDFKFGKRVINPQAANIQGQGIIYKYALNVMDKAEGKKPSDYKISIHSCRRNARKDVVSVIPIEPIFSDAVVLGNVGETVKAIRAAEKSGAFPMCMNEMTCSWCQYRDRCGLPPKQ